MNGNQTIDLNQSSTHSTTSINHLTFNEKIFAILIYSTISILSMIGNGITLFTILYFKRLRTPTNFLIGNLAVADILMATLCIPFSYWPFLIISYWPFGYLPCKLINFAQAAVVLGGAYTFVALSLDRFVAIIFPLKPNYKLTKRRALLWIVCVWFAALVVVSPLLAVLTLTDEQDGPQCNENWDDPREGAHGDGGYVYSIALMILQYFLPLTVFVLSYAMIGLKLWYSKVPGENNISLNRLRQDSVKKMLPTIFAVTMIYAVCWLPQNLLLIMAGLYPEINNYAHIQRIWWACHLLAMVHSVVNPIIYFFRNKAFRQGFAFVFHFCIPMIRYDGSLNADRVMMDFSSKGTYAMTTSRKRSSQRMSEWSTNLIKSPETSNPLADNRRPNITRSTKFTYGPIKIQH